MAVYYEIRLIEILLFRLPERRVLFALSCVVSAHRSQYVADAHAG